MACLEWSWHPHWIWSQLEHSYRGRRMKLLRTNCRRASLNLLQKNINALIDSITCHTMPLFIERSLQQRSVRSLMLQLSQMAPSLNHCPYCVLDSMRTFSTFSSAFVTIKLHSQVILRRYFSLYLSQSEIKTRKDFCGLMMPRSILPTYSSSNSQEWSLASLFVEHHNQAPLREILQLPPGCHFNPDLLSLCWRYTEVKGASSEKEAFILY